MGTKRKPSLEDAGKYLYEFMWKNASVLFIESKKTEWEDLPTHSKRVYIKDSLEIWKAVEAAI